MFTDSVALIPFMLFLSLEAQNVCTTGVFQRQGWKQRQHFPTLKQEATRSQPNSYPAAILLKTDLLHRRSHNCTQSNQRTSPFYVITTCSGMFQICLGERNLVRSTRSYGGPSLLTAFLLTDPQDGEDRQGDQTVGRLLLQREPKAAQEVGVSALRPAHGRGGRGLRADQTGQPPRRGGASHHEEIAQHPYNHPVAPHLLACLDFEHFKITPHERMREEERPASFRLIQRIACR